MFFDIKVDIPVILRKNYKGETTSRCGIIWNKGGGENEKANLFGCNLLWFYIEF